MLIGPGGNGKTSFLDLLTRFLGQSSVSNRSLHELENNRFAKASLFGKLANIYDDLSDKALRHTGTFKMLSGRSPIEAEKKWKESFNFTNYAKLIFSCNKVPKADDDTDAFFDRWILLTFPNKFQGDNRDPHIIDKLTAENELSGLLNIALKLLNRITEKAEISHSATTDEVRADYIRKSDPLGAFVMDCLKHDAEGWIPKQELYSLFTAYCRSQKLPSVSSRTFYMNLTRHIAVTDYRPEIKGERITAFRGIKKSEYAEQFASGTSRMSRITPTLYQLPGEYNKVEKYPDMVDTADADSQIGFSDLCKHCRKQVRNNDQKVEVVEGGKRYLVHARCHNK